MFNLVELVVLLFLFITVYLFLSLQSHSFKTVCGQYGSSQRNQSTIDFHLKYRWIVSRVSVHNHDRVLITVIMIALVNNRLRLAEAVSAGQLRQLSWPE